MPRFTEWAESQTHALPENAQQVLATDAFVVVNSILRSRASGLRYRITTCMNDKHPTKRAPFGSTVEGELLDDWLKVAEGLYLPMKIGNVPVLLPQEWFDDEKLDEQCQSHMWRGWTQQKQRAETPDPRSGGGALYEVVFDQVLIRAAPSPGAPRQDCRVKGDMVRLFEWDETRMWRKTVDQKTLVYGWMMLDHADYGPLLRPKGAPFSVKPLFPMCMAASEGNWLEVNRFLEEGVHPDGVDAGGYTPLMLAAQRGQLDVCVRLLDARADAALRSPEGSTAAEMVAPGPARELMLALSGHEGESVPMELRLEGIADNHLEQGLRQLSPEMRNVAQRLLDPDSKQADDQTGLVMKYIVDFANVWVCDAPNVNAEGLEMKMRGAEVDVYGYDDTGTWGRIWLQKKGVKKAAWIRICHEELGVLLSPVV